MLSAVSGPSVGLVNIVYLQGSNCWRVLVNRLISYSTTVSATRRQSDQAQAATHDALVDMLQQQGLLNERASHAMRAIDRAFFVQTYLGVPGTVAYQDTQLPISCGQHMAPPSVIARVLTLLESHIHPGSRVLDVGTGSGYVAACLAHLAAPGGVVLTLDKQQKLVERAKHNLEHSAKALVESGTLDVRVCNAMADPSELQGSELYDAIHLGASVEQVPERFVQLLKPGGRMVLPFGAMHGAAAQVLMSIDKTKTGTIATNEHGGIDTRIAPLTAVHDDQVLP